MWPEMVYAIGCQVVVEDALGFEPMDEFIIRIYRQNESLESSNDIFGVVERIGNQERQTFRSMQELWALLCAATADGNELDAPPQQ